MLPETTKETLSKDEKNNLIMVKTNGPNSLTETEEREGSEGDASRAAATE